MKLRYYLRGIGIGMAVTAMILHFSVNAATPEMTDEEIIARAEALGMIENTVLSANDPALDDGEETVTTEPATSEIAATEQPVEESSTTQEEEQAGTEEPSGTEVPEETDETSGVSEASPDTEIPSEEIIPSEEDIPPAGEEAEESSETQQEGMTGNEAVEEYVIITIVSGDSSVSVAGKLADAGLVSSKAEYDAYLCANGYDRKICTGNHEIPMGATEKEIAEIITTRP